MKALPYLMLVAAAMACNTGQAQLSEDPDGAEIMQAVQRNIYQEKAVYEELLVILTDELGNRDTRSLRKYTRVSSEDDIKFLLLFDSPEDFRGVALLARKQGNSNPDVTVYLPAYGDVFRHAALWDQGETLFGTDFTMREISRVFTGNYRYERREDRKIENIDYYVVDVIDDSIRTVSTTPVMQHYIRQDGLYITRTDYLDRYGRLMKQLTMHDIKSTDKKMWNAAMYLMEDRQREHSTLIKVVKRIVSDDYVPEEVFTINWLYENQPPLDSNPAEGDDLEIELIDAGQIVPDNALVQIKASQQ